MSDLPCGDPAPPRPNTARAFLLAPGIAAAMGGLCGGLILVFEDPADWTAIVVIPLAGFVVLAVVGYLTALIIAVPVYLVLPERVRRCSAVVVPLAGAIAAAPWSLGVAPWRNGFSALSILGVPFGLGVVAGIAFLYLRRPSDAIETEP